MAKFISDIHEFINFLTGKGQTGYHSPEEIDNAVHEASLDLWSLLYKRFEETQEISDDLSPFVVGPATLTLDVNGQVNKPDSYKHLLSLTGGSSGVDVDVIDIAMFSGRRNSVLCPPSVDYPICAFYNTVIQFYPTTLTNVKITYLKTPTKPEWAYDVTDERYVYSDTDSVDIEWKENRHPDIRAKALEFLGINLRENELVEFAQIKKQEVA